MQKSFTQILEFQLILLFLSNKVSTLSDIKILIFWRDSRAKFVDRSSGGAYIKIHEPKRNSELLERKCPEIYKISVRIKPKLEDIS